MASPSYSHRPYICYITYVQVMFYFITNKLLDPFGSFSKLAEFHLTVYQTLLLSPFNHLTAISSRDACPIYYGVLPFRI